MKFRPAPIAALGAALATAAVAVPSSSTAGEPSSLQVNEKVASATFVQHRKATKRGELAAGDSVVTRQSLFNDSDQRVGTLYTDCTNVGAKAPLFRALLSCSATYRFADGDIVASGVIKLSDLDSELAVTGGTVAYEGVGGTVEAAEPTQGYDSREEISLDGQF